MANGSQQCDTMRRAELILKGPIPTAIPGPRGEHPAGHRQRGASSKAVLYYANTILAATRFQLPPRGLNAWSRVDQVQELNLSMAYRYT